MADGRLDVVVKPGQWGWSFPDLVASWRLAEEAGFDGLSCFDHVSGSAERAWGPVATLAAMAAATERIALAVHVLNVALRNPLLLAGELAVVQAASNGRLRVGLGAGSGFAAADHRAAGIAFPPFADRVRLLEACCRVLPALWRAETVTDEGLGLHDAGLGSLGIDPPPLVVGGHSDRVLEIAARHADAWNGHGDEAAAWSETHARLVARCGAVGRERPITPEAQVFADPYLAHRGSALREHVAALAAAGAARVVLVVNRERGPAAVERLAAAVL